MASKDRQRQLERERYERVQARMAQQRAAAKKRNVITAVVAAVAVVGVGVGVALLSGDNGKKPDSAAANPNPTSSSTPTSAATTAAPVAVPIPGCSAVPAGLKANTSLSWKAEPPMTIDTKKTYTMTMTTNCGDIVVQMDASKTPHTVNSFNFLAGQKYFDGSYCHRLSNQGSLLMLQCGDPTKNPANPAPADGPGPGYTIPDENLTGATYPAGTVAMANTGQPNSGSAQFFLVFGDTQLDPSYTPVGKITKGLDTLKAIAAAGVDNPSSTDGTGYPHQPVMLEKVTVAPN